MKKITLPFLFLLMTLNVNAQQDFFALTGNATNQVSFKDFRAIDINNGISGEKIFGVNDLANVFSQNFDKNITEIKSTPNHSQTPSIAALAYNEFTNELVYIPMFSSNIYFLDKDTKKITMVENNVIKNSSCDINSHITRMTAGYDGNMYALNNAGTQFLQISRKNGKYTVIDLGNIKDDASNGNNLLGKKDTGFGGDMIADADNNFYVFSASGNVFKLFTKNLNAKFIGKISGLPKDYTLNGAAVDASGKIIIANMRGANFYELNLETLNANPLMRNFDVNTYDLASKYFINDAKSSIISNNISIYPTLVKENYFNVSIPAKDFKNNTTLEIYNYNGSILLSKKLSTNFEKIDFKNLNEGVYLVNIKNNSGKVLLKKKILVSK